MTRPKRDRVAITATLYDFDRSLQAEGTGVIVGIDEAGRGPLAGPVMAAAVVLDLNVVIPGINDSKQLTPSAREDIFDGIPRQAMAFSVGSASVEEIDRVNILQATFLAMQRALKGITVHWVKVIIDGNQPLPGLPADRQVTIVRGDAQSASIAAASIVAKVTRDRLMKDYHRDFPMYDFLSNKGYGTDLHRKRILEFGMCEHHRRSFCDSLSAQTRLEL